MNLTIKNSRGKKISIHDNMGRTILGVCSFNTKTCAIVFYPVTLVSGKPVTLTELDSEGKGRIKKVKTIWKGAYAVVDGKRIEQ